MKILRLFFCLCLLSWSTPAHAQITTWAQGFDKSANAASARAYLGLGTNGGGGITSFSADPLSGLFTVSVLTPTTTPRLQFQLESQGANLVFASPNGSPGQPSFRALTSADLPPASSSGVTNFAAGTAGALFTTSVGTPTSWPTLSFNITSQNQNLFYASPNGSSGAPTFRSILAGDLPDLSTLIRSKVSGTAPVSYDSATGIFSMHVADSTHDGYLSAAAYNTFSSGTGGGASKTDIMMTNMTAYANGTNFCVDFNWSAQTVLATGDIAFNYSTNWGLSQTSRVANLIIPPTNLLRHVLFLGPPTNWHNTVRPFVAIPTGFGATIQFQLFGQGETNVTYAANIDLAPTGTNWLLSSFNPTNSQGGCKLWWEATQQTSLDEFGIVPTFDGSVVRSWNDLSNFSGRATNGNMACYLYFRAPNSAPGNIPCLNFVSGAPAWLVTTQFSNLPQPNWCFMMFYGRGTALSFLDGLSEGNRFACIPSESSVNNIQLYSGSGLNAASAPSVAWRLFAFCQNSTTSIIRTNGVQAVSGNSGTQTPARWIIGSDYPFSSYTGQGYLAELLIYSTNLSNIQVTNVENYFRTKYGAW